MSLKKYSSWKHKLAWWLHTHTMVAYSKIIQPSKDHLKLGTWYSCISTPIISYEKHSMIFFHQQEQYVEPQEICYSDSSNIPHTWHTSDFFFQAPALWNALPDETENSSMSNIFKTRLNACCKWIHDQSGPMDGLIACVHNVVIQVLHPPILYNSQTNKLVFSAW